MKPPEKLQKAEYFLLAFSFLFLLGILLVVSANRSMGNDEGMWSYMGRIWVENSLPPYSQSVENKTPGVFVLHALSYQLFGIGYFFVRILGIVAILAGGLLLYRIASRLHSPFAGILSLLVFGLSMGWVAMDGSYTGQTETFMVAFSIAGIYFLLKGIQENKANLNLFLCGFFMGMAIAFKQVAILTCVPIFFYLMFFSKEKWKKTAFKNVSTFSIGVLLATFISIVPLLLSGVGFMNYIDGAWLILLRKGSSVPLHEHLANFQSVWGHGKMLVFYPFLLLIGYVLIKKKSRIYNLLAFIMLFDFIAVNLSGNYYGHQFKQLLPALSLLIALCVSYLIHLIINKKRKGFIQITTVFLSILCFFPFAQNLNPGNLKNIVFSENESHDRAKKTGDWIKNHTSADDYIYVLNYHHNQILSYSGRVSSSRFFNFIFVNDAKEVAEVLADLKQKPPKLVIGNFPLVIPAHDFERYILENYRKVRTIHGIEIRER